MYDIQLRPLKDKYIDPLCALIPSFVPPLQVTLFAFASGCLACYASVVNRPFIAVAYWLLNRVLDCLDGALARRRQQASDFGGFIDLLCDFTVYSFIPISCALSQDLDTTGHLWLSVSIVEASFHVNNFVLFYVAAIVEKGKAKATADNDEKQEKELKELTSVAMKPAVIEGFESGVLFTVMLAFPIYTEMVCWVMAALVCIGICQRVVWLAFVIS